MQAPLDVQLVRPAPDGSGELAAEGGEGLGLHRRSAIDLENTGGSEQLDAGPLRVERSGRTQRSLARTTPFVVEQHADPAKRSSMGPHAHHSPEGGVEQVDDMRAEVGQRTSLQSPGRRERAAQQRARDERASPPAASNDAACARNARTGTA